MNEYEKMIRGYWYDANFDTALIAMRLRAEELCFRFNHTSPAKTEERQRILNELLPHMQEQVTILSPFHVDYGAHCQIGEGTFLNHNAYLMDGGRITIGARCFIGPNCGIYTARHPLCRCAASYACDGPSLPKRPSHSGERPHPTRSRSTVK